jgi:SAM-dependent methyltransferase
MPRIVKTIAPRIRKSVSERGILISLFRAFLLPIHLVREFKTSKQLRRAQSRSDFDQRHNVDTDGDFDDWTYLSDLQIESPNWIYGNNYCGIEPERFRAIMDELDIGLNKFTFVDFGSGKGRALLLASEFPFRKIAGVEFSQELHSAAERNIRNYQSASKKCSSIKSVCEDFVDYELPPEPSVFFFFDPCAREVLERLFLRVKKSLQDCPRKSYLIYVAPGVKQSLLDSTDFLSRIHRNEKYNFSLYECKNVHDSVVSVEASHPSQRTA